MLEAVLLSIQRRAEAKLLFRGRHGHVCTFELDNLEVPAFWRNRRVQQGQGSSPTLFHTFAERLLWRQWDAMAAIEQWGILAGGMHMARVSWAGCNLLVAAGAGQMQAMLPYVRNHLPGLVDRRASKPGLSDGPPG